MHAHAFYSLSAAHSPPCHPPHTFCSVYALASGPNYFILIPNIAGLGLFGMQLCVYRLYSPFYFVGEERPTAKLIGGRDRTEVDESSFQPSASCSEPLVEPTADDGGGAGSSSSGKI